MGQKIENHHKWFDSSLLKVHLQAHWSVFNKFLINWYMKNCFSIKIPICWANVTR